MKNIRKKVVAAFAAVGLIVGVAVVTNTDNSKVGAKVAYDPSIQYGDLPGWKQVFAEPFDTFMPLGGWKNSVYYNSKFRAYGPSNSSFTSWKDSSGHGRYMPEIMDVGVTTKGALTERIQTKNGYPYVAAIAPRIPGQATSDMLYGRYIVRARFPRLSNYKVAYLLWPQSGDHLVDGEIDFPEINLWRTSVRGFVHYTDQVAGPTQQGWYIGEGVTFDAWHNYTIEWTPQKVVFLIDGVVVKTVTGARVPHTPMHWVMQTETGIGVPTPAASVKGNVQLGWIAIWSYAPETLPAP